jgi:hypothetical protein
LKVKYENDQRIRMEEHAKIDELKRREEEKKNEFLQTIKSCKDFQDNLDSYCENLKNLVDATGVYVMSYEKKRRINILEEDDENAHLLEDIVLRYLNFCQDHAFLKNKNLEPGQGVSYDLVIPKEDTPEENKQLEEGNSTENPEDGQKIKKELDPKNKEIKEVVGSEEGTKIKFFREPRLGSYLAVDMSYNSSLSQSSLLSAIENKREYEKNLAIQDERRREYEARHAEAKQHEAKDGNTSGEINHDDNQGNPDSSLHNTEGFIEEKVELQDYKKTEKKILLCLDTLGQDRPFTDEQKKFIFETVKTIKSSWEQLEERLLLKDRDLRIDIEMVDFALKDQFPPEKLELEEEKFVKEYFNSEKFIENPITDERIKGVESDFMKSRYMINSFFDEDHMKQAFLTFAKFEFIEFERLFQNALYFIGYQNKEINEENTNKLEWKKARKFWNERVLEKLRDYNPFGPKSGKLPSYQMGNRLIQLLETINKEDLRNASFVLSRLLDFLLLILKVRKDDIIRRRDVVNELIEKRRAAIEEHRARAEKRETELEEIRRKNSELEEGQEPVNEDEFLEKWDQEHPEIIIPEEVFHDVDEDMEI